MGEIELGLRVMLGGVFLVAVTKLRSQPGRAAFLDQVRVLAQVPVGLTRALAVAVASGEVAALPLLAIPRWADAGFLLTGFLLCGFLASTAWALHRGSTVSCRCFGFGTAAMGQAHLWRNSLLLAAAVTGFLLPGGAVSNGARLTVAVFGGLAGAVVAVLFTEFVGIFTGGKLSTTPVRAAAARPPVPLADRTSTASSRRNAEAHLKGTR